MRAIAGFFVLAGLLAGCGCSHTVYVDGDGRVREDVRISKSWCLGFGRPLKP
jgi:hypothetical protein